MKLKFECFKETNFGDEVYVSGNILELGKWNVNNSVKLSPINYPKWEIELELSSEYKEIEYKFLVKKSDNYIEWDYGKNKIIEEKIIQMGRSSKKFKKQQKNKQANFVELKKCIHEVAVMATMSSGKSTLINALLGEDILPNENQACTAKIFKIIDDDGREENKVTAIYKSSEMKNIVKENLSDLNKDPEIKEVIIEGDFEGIQNKKLGGVIHQICLVDTPGPNNSLDNSHKEIALGILKDEKTSRLVYVLNATQIGVNDDKKLLLDIQEYQNVENKNLEILFILNKADEILKRQENLEVTIKNAKNYLSEIGFENSKIIPISAYAAKLFKFALEDRLKTRKEKLDFKEYYGLFGEDKLSDLTLVNDNIYHSEYIMIKEKGFSKNEILKRLYSTGIIDLEKELENVLEESIVNEKNNSLITNK